MMFDGGLIAAAKIDKKLYQARKSKPNDTVRVIIQVRNPAGLSAKALKGQAILIKKFRHFPGGVLEIKLKDLDKLDDSDTISISSDEPMRGTSTDGTEAPNNSSGGS